MKWKFFLVWFIFCSLSCVGQKSSYIDGQQVFLQDTLTNYLYVLDESHKFITAFNACGDSLWSTQPISTHFPISVPLPITEMSITQISDLRKYYKNDSLRYRLNDYDGKVLHVSAGLCVILFRIDNGKWFEVNCD